MAGSDLVGIFLIKLPFIISMVVYSMVLTLYLIFLSPSLVLLLYLLHLFCLTSFTLLTTSLFCFRYNPCIERQKFINCKYVKIVKLLIVNVQYKIKDFTSSVLNKILNRKMKLFNFLFLFFFYILNWVLRCRFSCRKLILEQKYNFIKFQFLYKN